ncbi:RDD family protein [Streptomyces sp. AHA2]|uniref:RDD family protein n=1 Tax=Streptomyces sp. AHA2 TaxID=3064526 RepID=UPI003FA70D1E
MPGTSRPAPKDGEPLAPPPGAGAAPVASVEETGPHFFDEDPVDRPSPADAQHGSRPEPASAWGADRARQSGFGGEQDRRVSWGAPQGAQGTGQGGAPHGAGGAQGAEQQGPAVRPEGDPRTAPADSGSAGGTSAPADGTVSAQGRNAGGDGTFVFRRPAGKPGAPTAADAPDEGTMTFRAVPPRGAASAAQAPNASPGTTSGAPSSPTAPPEAPSGPAFGAQGGPAGPGGGEGGAAPAGPGGLSGPPFGGQGGAPGSGGEPGAAGGASAGPAGAPSGPAFRDRGGAAGAGGRAGAGGAGSPGQAGTSPAAAFGAQGGAAAPAGTGGRPGPAFGAQGGVPAPGANAGAVGGAVPAGPGGAGDGPGFAAGKAAAARAAAAQAGMHAPAAPTAVSGPQAGPTVPPQSPGPGTPSGGAAPLSPGPGGGQSSWAQQVHRLAGGVDEQPVAPWKPPVEDVFQAAARRQASARPAGLGKRLAARLLDTLVLTGVTAVAAVPLGTKAVDHVTEKIDAARLSGETVTVWLLDGTTSVYLGIILAVLLLVGVVSEVLPTARWGRTLGKKLMGLEVRDIEGHEAPEFGAALRRWLVYSVPGLLVVGVVGIAWCLFDRPWRQCWHDKAAHTFVAG